MRKPIVLGLLVLPGLLIACDGGEPSTSAETREPPAATTTPDPLATPSIDDRFPVDGGTRLLALRCWGEGSPTVLFDAGSGDTGISNWSASPIVRDLARQTQVCTYDRAGVGLSDPAPDRARMLDDVVDDLHELLIAADVTPPFLMVGSSGGGFDVYHHAGRYPDEVAGLVMLDVPPGQAEWSAEEAAELAAWESPGNREHVDYLAVERQMALQRLPIPAIPVTVITATSGQSAADPKSQTVWLEGSSHPVHVVLNGGHEIDQDAPAEVLAEIQQVYDLIP